jgi:hypothetical protein
MQITVTVPENERGAYVVRCAKIRDMTVTALVRELVDTIINDELVLAILDDDGKHKHGPVGEGDEAPRAVKQGTL